MHRLRRLIAWAFYFGFLAAVGAGVFVFVRYRPRCTITGPFDLMHFSADGSRMIVVKQAVVDGKWQRRPVQVWDTRDGRLIREFLDDADVIAEFGFSPDGQHAAFGVGDGSVRIIDWQKGQVRRLDGPHKVENCDFSPSGRWLSLGQDVERLCYFVEVTTGKTMLQLAAKRQIPSFGERFVVQHLPLEHSVICWDLESGKKLGSMATTSERIVVSPDGRLALSWRSRPFPAAKNGEAAPGGGKPPNVDDRRIRDAGIDVWELPTFRHRFRTDRSQGETLEAAFAPDGSHLAVWLSFHQQESNLELFDTAAGRLLWSSPMKRGEQANFAPDGSLLWFGHYSSDERGQPLVTIFDVVTGRSLWERPLWSNAMTFAGATGILLYENNETHSLEFLDARTGESKATLPLNNKPRKAHPKLTPNGRHLVMRVNAPDQESNFGEKWLGKWWPDQLRAGAASVLVVETTTARELFRVASDSGYLLSDDGRTLLTFEDAFRMEPFGVNRIWDVYPHRAYAWAVGMVAAVMLALFAVSRSLRAWRKRYAAAKSASTVGGAS